MVDTRQLTSQQSKKRPKAPGRRFSRPEAPRNRSKRSFVQLFSCSGWPRWPSARIMHEVFQRVRIHR